MSLSRRLHSHMSYCQVSQACVWASTLYAVRVKRKFLLFLQTRSVLGPRLFELFAHRYWPAADITRPATFYVTSRLHYRLCGLCLYQRTMYNQRLNLEAMRLCCLYVLLCCTMLSYSYSLNKTLCSNSSCLHLYESDDAIAWKESLTACNRMGQELLSVESPDDQRAVESLLQDLPEDDGIEVWTSGYASVTEWRYMNGSKLENINVITSGEDNQGCLTVRICQNGYKEYIADQCTETNGNIGLLCQIDSVGNALLKCPASYSHYGDKCYLKTMYDGREYNRIDWYKGQTYCNQMHADGVIAYSALRNGTFIESIKRLMGERECFNLWLGIRRDIWYWKKGAGKIEENVAVKYFNWQKDLTLYNPSDSCISINHARQNEWKANHGVDSRVRYFVCVSGLNVTVSAEVSNFKIVYVTPLVVGLVLIAVVILVSLLYIRKRKSKPKQHVYANDNIDLDTVRQSTATENPYAEIAPIPDNLTHDDIISPYAEVGRTSSGGFLNRIKSRFSSVSKKNNGEMEHSNEEQTAVNVPPGGSTLVNYKQAPSGDLYALSGKKLHMNQNGSSNGGDDNTSHSKAPSTELYAIPQKKGRGE